MSVADAAGSRRSLAAVLLLTACGCAAPSAPRAADPDAPVVAAPADTVGWYRIAPERLLLVARGPEGGLRALDFGGARFASLAPRPEGGWTWQFGDHERTVVFESTAADGIVGLRWAAEGDTGHLPRVAGPFAVHDVHFDAGGLRLAGSLLVPARPAAGLPAAAIVHGSGASDRDNVWAYHIAQHLARAGITVMLPDKRGSGASGGDWRSADFHALARDAIAGLEAAREQVGDAASCTGLVGLSQGGWVAPLAARLDPRVDFVAGVSAAAVPVRDQLAHEIRQDLSRAGFGEADIARALRLFELADAFAAVPSDSTWTAYAQVRAGLLADTLAPFASALPDAREAWWWSWWAGVRAFDPLPHWQALDVPIAIAYGAEDEHDNLPVMASVARLRASTSSRVSVRVFEGSGHALADSATGWIRPDFLAHLTEQFLAACVPSRGASPDLPATRLVREYLAAYNTGDATRLARTLEQLYAPAFLSDFGGAEAAAWNRLELLRTYGPLALDHVDTTATPAIVWTRGTISRGWVGHQFHLNDAEPPRVTRHVVWRAKPVPPPVHTLAPRELADSMRSYLDELERADLFSGAVTLSHRGEPVLAGAWGTDGRDPAQPIERDTRFHIASVTKLLTATALLHLAEAGTVSLDDRLGEWIPEYPRPWADRVLLRDLLTHTSGIELDDDAAYLEAIRVARDVDDLLAAQLRYIRGREPRFEPGTEYDYTSEGFDLAAVVIERATGKRWADVVRESVLTPAGMSDTRLARPTDEGRWAVGFTSLESDLETVTPGLLRRSVGILPVVAKPSAGAWSTADDLHRLMRALLEGSLLASAWRDSLLTPAFDAGELPKYGIVTWTGLGAQGEDLWGVRTAGHGGVVPGYSAAIEYFPESGWLLTVVSNTGEATGYLVFQRMLDLVGRDDP